MLFSETMLPRSVYKHVAPALLVGLGLRMFFIWRFPFTSGDTSFYEELARNWLYHGIYGFFSNGHLHPSDMRAPGYPGFLSIIYFLAGSSRMPVLIAQALVDLATCVLTALVAARLVSRVDRRVVGGVSVGALWLAILCPFTANYTSAILTETLATFLTTLAVLIFLLPPAMDIELLHKNRQVLLAALTWFLGGIVVGLGTLVRPEAPLLLVAVLVVLWVRRRRRANWRKLAVATLWMLAGLLLPLAPWAARNARTFGRVQFLAPRYAETFGDYIPTGFYAWTSTWMFRFRDAYLFTWKLPAQPISIDDLPSYGFDSREELLRVTSLLEEYNRGLGMTRQLDLEFKELADERKRQHPFRSYVWIPIERATAIWFTPRIASLPYSGRLWPPVDSWHRNSTDFNVTIGFSLVNCFYVGLALVGLAYSLKNPGVAVIVVFIVLRTGFLTQLPTCEPRYVLVCFPGLLALGAQVWGRSWIGVVQPLPRVIPTAQLQRPLAVRAGKTVPSP
jgi:hypothetical protein